MVETAVAANLTAPPRLYAAPGGGSMIVEAAYAIAGAPLDIVELRWADDWATSPFAKINPLLQVPTLVFGDGVVMTESAAMLLDLADRHPEAGLAPPLGHLQRRAFLRWLILWVAAVYPTFTYGDLPPRFVEGDEAAGQKLRRATDARRENIYRQYEAAVAGDWFLGDSFSAIDLYIWVSNAWRPGRAWFESNAPKLSAIADRVAAMAPVRAVAERNARGEQPPVQ